MQCATMTPDGTPMVMLKELPQNQKVKHWLRTACEFVAGHKACLIISCDTQSRLNTLPRWRRGCCPSIGVLRSSALRSQRLVPLGN